MTLADLFPDLAAGAHGVPVVGITADSRNVRPGMVFAALQGTATHGAAFVPHAIGLGAAAILTDTDAKVDANVPVLRDPDPRRRLALAAARLSGRQPGTVVAVTGTAGKTSVAEFTRQIFAAVGLSAVSIGTLGLRGAIELPGGLTTMDPVKLHARLAELADAGVDHVAMEASSHGIDQRRIDGVRLTAAAFTNIGRDHLDYHATFEAYLAAKARLFSLLPEGAPAVLDPDSPGADTMIAAAQRVLTVGRRGEFLRLTDMTATPSGTRLVVEGGGRHTVKLPLAGTFQVDNALIAAGLAMAAGVSEADAVAALQSLKGAPGRLEVVAHHHGAPVFVDYAHKPDAITAALRALRAIVPGRLVIVVGAGGDRDPGKRPIMGAAAAALADVVIVTDDNPRSEDPAVIRAAVLSGAPQGVEVGDRREAIAYGLSLLSPGDALVVAGKGHEEGQTVGAVTHPFKDADVVRELAERS